MMRKSIKTVTLTDNDYQGKALADMWITADNEQNLKRIADIDISKIKLDDHPNLFVFPPRIEDANDKVGDGQICSIHDGRIFTGNVMGFVGIGNTQLSIKSRFAQSCAEDYFLHYMLCRVLSLNVLTLNHNFNNLSLFDFLLYLFPSYLLVAYRQGLYKTYLHRQYNDARVRGTIDVARHIRKNFPFAGNVAYNTREMSYDNNVTQLVRHTIEYVEHHTCVANILSQSEDVREAVRAFKEATPTYNYHNRQAIINLNLRPITHPYFTAYTNLQHLCLMILRHDGLKYEGDKSDVYGILFDGAWLWEEYLNTLLKKKGFVHAENKKHKNGLTLCKDHTIYPDFYKNGQIVVDAKYKGLDTDGRISREDLYQVVNYMYALKAKSGGVAFPSREQTKRIDIGALAGYGGTLCKFPFLIPQKATDMFDFCRQMSVSEKCFLQSVE